MSELWSIGVRQVGQNVEFRQQNNRLEDDHNHCHDNNGIIDNGIGIVDLNLEDSARSDVCVYNKNNDSEITLTLPSHSSMEALADAISCRCAPVLERQRMRLIYRGRVIYDGSSIVMNAKESSSSSSPTLNENDNPGSSNDPSNESVSLNEVQLKDVAGMCDGQTVHLVPRPVQVEAQQGRSNADTDTSVDQSNDNGNRNRSSNIEDDDTANAMISMLLSDAFMTDFSSSDNNENSNLNPARSTTGQSNASSVGGLLGVLISNAITNREGTGSGGVISGVIRTEIRRNGVNNSDNPNATALNISANSNSDDLRNRLIPRTTSAIDSNATTADSNDDDNALGENRANMVVSAIRRARLMDIDGSADRRDWRRQSIRVPSTSRDAQQVNFDNNPIEPLRQNLMTVHSMLHATALMTPPTETESMIANRRVFYRGQWVDVRDTVNAWLEATILDVITVGDIRQHHLHHNDITNIEISSVNENESDNVADRTDSRQQVPIRSSSAFLRHNDAVLVRGSDLASRDRNLVQPMDPDDFQLVRIHYNGWPSDLWDEWIRSDSERIRLFRTRTVHDDSNVVQYQHASPVIEVRPMLSSSESTNVRIGNSNNDSGGIIEDIPSTAISVSGNDDLSNNDNLTGLLVELSRALTQVNAVVQQSIPQAMLPLNDGIRENNIGSSSRRLPWLQQQLNFNEDSEYTNDVTENTNRSNDGQSDQDMTQHSVLVPALLDRLGRALIDAAPLINNQSHYGNSNLPTDGEREDSFLEPLFGSTNEGGDNINNNTNFNNNNISDFNGGMVNVRRRGNTNRSSNVSASQRNSSPSIPTRITTIRVPSNPLRNSVVSVSGPDDVRNRIDNEDPNAIHDNTSASSNEVNENNDELLALYEDELHEDYEYEREQRFRYNNDVNRIMMETDNVLSNIDETDEHDDSSSSSWMPLLL